MSNKTNIEEAKKELIKVSDFLKFYLHNRCMPILNEREIVESIESLELIEELLADRERLEKENEELLEVKVSASAHNIIEELTRENLKLKTELENRRKEYQDTYKDVREELKELQAKANKYDSLVEKIKEIVSRLKISDIEPWTTYNVPGDILFDFQELLDTES